MQIIIIPRDEMLVDQIAPRDELMLLDSTAVTPTGTCVCTCTCTVYVNMFTAAAVGVEQCYTFPSLRAESKRAPN